MRLVVTLIVALVPALAVAAPTKSPVTSAPGDELEAPPSDAESEPPLTDEEIAAEEESEATIEEIEDEVFGRPKRDHRPKHRRTHRKHRGPEHTYALAMNVPLGGGLGGSLYRALSRHHAIRLNVAAYNFTPVSPGLGVLAGLLGEPIEDVPSQEGGTLDVGAGWMLFPVRLWEGPTLELGVVRRAVDTKIYSESPAPIVGETSSKYAGRALVGWTWKFGSAGRVFVAMALGASYGHIAGERTTQRVDNIGQLMGSPTSRSFARWETAFECYTRVGFTFGDVR